MKQKICGFFFILSLSQILRVRGKTAAPINNSIFLPWYVQQYVSSVTVLSVDSGFFRKS